MKEGNGSYQWLDASDSVNGQVRIGHNEMSVPLVGIEPPSSKMAQSESQTLKNTKTVSALDHSATPLSSGVVAK